MEQTKTALPWFCMFLWLVLVNQFIFWNEFGSTGSTTMTFYEDFTHLNRDSLRLLGLAICISGRTPAASDAKLSGRSQGRRWMEQMSLGRGGR